MWLWILIGILFILVVISFIYYSMFYKAYANILKSFADLDIVLKKRFDLVPNLISIVKSYAKYEKDTLNSINNICKVNYNNLNRTAKLKLGSIVSEIFSHMLILKEKYPDLKSSDAYLELMKNISKLEDDVANNRKNYNDNIATYNKLIGVYPAKLFAYLFNFKTKDYYGISDGERNSIKVDL